MGKIVAICNQKGGVGKTTTCINLAAFMAQCGKKVLVLDLDPQANATSGLGIDKAKISFSIYDVLLREVGIKEAILPTAIENLQMLPARIELIGAELELQKMEDRQFRVKTLLDVILADFEFIFIDLPPSLGLLTVNGLAAAHSTLIPIQCEYYALEGLSQLLVTIEKIKQAFNPALFIEGVLLTMADFRTTLCHDVISEARRYFKEKVYQTIIPRSVRLSEAPGFGKPILLYDPNSAGAVKYAELCREILSKDAHSGLTPCVQENKSSERGAYLAPDEDKQAGKDKSEAGLDSKSKIGDGVSM